METETGNVEDAPFGSALPDILAVIESAKTRGGIEGLQRFVAKALPEAEQFEIEDDYWIVNRLIKFEGPKFFNDFFQTFIKTTIHLATYVGLRLRK